MLTSVLAFAALLAGTAAPETKNHPPIEHPPGIELSPADEKRIYAAIDADGIEVSAIEITSLDAFDVAFNVILVYGSATKRGATVCRGDVFTYEDDGAGNLKRIPVGAFAIVPATDCSHPPETASRILIEAGSKDDDITGIVDAVRSSRVPPDRRNRIEMPAYLSKAPIKTILIRGDRAVVHVARKVEEGELGSLFLIKHDGQWIILDTGTEIALPDR
jgi:hypothetical protein